MTAEVNRGETVVWKAGNSELRCKLGIIGDVVLVLKAIVAYREFIHAAGVDRPCVGYAHLGTAHDLSLDGVDRLSWEWQECSIAVPRTADQPRSEEHTSELQSPDTISYA